jgi:DSP-PTPase phosphatase fused to NAD+ Kinase
MQLYTAAPSMRTAPPSDAFPRAGRLIYRGVTMRRPGLRSSVVLAICAGLLLAGLLALLHVQDLFWPRNFGVVTEGAIYRSARLSPSMLTEVVERHGIRTLVDLGAYADPERGHRVDEVLHAHGAERVAIRMHGDGRGNPNGYLEALRVMADPARRPVLIQCAAGAQRTSALVLLYRRVVEGVPIQETYPESFDFGHEPDEWILLAYLADWAGPIEAAFRTGGPVANAAPLPPPGAGGIDARDGARPLPGAPGS